MNDQYKNLFKGIIIFLVTAVILLFLSIILPSCHSQKQATTTSSEYVDDVRSAASSTETAARTQWMSSLNIDLDSFELWMPTFMDRDTAACLPLAFADPYTSQPHLKSNMVVLKGKRASIGKADLAERNASRYASQVDSVAAHRTMDKSDHYARDTVGITKPPDITWWPLAILAALAIIAGASYFLKSK